MDKYPLWFEFEVDSFKVALRDHVQDINKKLVELDIDAGNVITMRESALLEQDSAYNRCYSTVPALEILYKKRVSHN